LQLRALKAEMLTGPRYLLQQTWSNLTTARCGRTARTTICRDRQERAAAIGAASASGSACPIRVQVPVFDLWPPAFGSSSPSLRAAVQQWAFGRKMSDEFTVPLCRSHHREVHRSSECWMLSALARPRIQIMLMPRREHQPAQSSCAGDDR
jgi:hypothetical protein